MVWNDADPGSPRHRVPLSAAQRRELVQIIGAGVLSISLVVYMIATAASPGDAAAAAPAPEATAVSAMQPPAPTVRVVSTEWIAPVSAPAITPPLTTHLPDAPSPLRTVRPSQPRTQLARARTEPASTPGRLTKKLARFVVGDGQFAVRPFPTVPELER